MQYEISTFKDGQVSARIANDGDINVVIRGKSYEDLFAVASVKEAWDAKNAMIPSNVATLTIYCLIGQRSDRRFQEGESFDLKVIANFINGMGFNKVRIFHPHSAISLALIHNAEAISHMEYVEKAYHEIGAPVLVSPDAGAYKTTHVIAKKIGAALIPANKVRIENKPVVVIQGDVKDRDCLIVDDLADGGRTFTQLAKSLKEQGAGKVYLYVSHGQFHHGFEELKENIEHIYCTNSYRDIDNEYVTQYVVI